MGGIRVDNLNSRLSFNFQGVGLETFSFARIAQKASLGFRKSAARYHGLIDITCVKKLDKHNNTIIVNNQKASSPL